jgi:GDP-4-dehydro-6-deoxy-D-mannose reductase
LTAQGAITSGLGPEAEPPVARFATWFSCDITDAGNVVDAIARGRPSAVVHLAGQSSAARSFERPEETFRINAIGTWNLLDAVRRAAPDARVLVVGTGESYGPRPEGTRADEECDFAPVSPYGFSKAVADEMAHRCARDLDLDVVRTRSFSHIGPGQAERFVVPSVARQIAEVETGRGAPVIQVGNLDVTRDLTDVRDVARAYVTLLERGRRGAAYNVCRGEGVSLERVVHGLCERARVRVAIERDPARMRPADVPYLVGDPARLERETGWRAEIPLDRSLDDVLAEWRARVA